MRLALHVIGENPIWWTSLESNAHVEMSKKNVQDSAPWIVSLLALISMNVSNGKIIVAVKIWTNHTYIGRDVLWYNEKSLSSNTNVHNWLEENWLLIRIWPWIGNGCMNSRLQIRWRTLSFSCSYKALYGTVEVAFVFEVEMSIYSTMDLISSSEFSYRQNFVAGLIRSLTTLNCTIWQKIETSSTGSVTETDRIFNRRRK